MVWRKAKTSLDKVLKALEESKDVINYRAIFNEINTAEDVEPTRSKIYTACITEVENCVQLQRVMSHLNKLNIPSTKKTTGNMLYHQIKKYLGIITVEEVPFLLDIAYTRALRHFNPAGEYLKEFIQIDNDLAMLPKYYAKFKQAIKKHIPDNLPEEKQAEIKASLESVKRRIHTYGEYNYEFSKVSTYSRINSIARYFQNAAKRYEEIQRIIDPSCERLHAFLHYLDFVDTDFKISSIRDVYDTFEEVISFCRTIPSKYIDYPELKETVCKGKWRSFKNRIDDQELEAHEWIDKMKDFESQKKVNLAEAVATYLKYDDVFKKTKRLAFRN